LTKTSTSYIEQALLQVLVNSKHLEESVRSGSYLPITRRWKKGDEVRLNLSMSVDFLETHPHSSNNSRLAISRGPIIYCIEGADHPGVNIFDIVLPADTKLTPHFKSSLLGGVVALKGTVLLQNLSNWQGKLYRPYRKEKKTKTELLEVTAIPYYAWANRGSGKMSVWARRNDY